MRKGAVTTIMFTGRHNAKLFRGIETVMEDSSHGTGIFTSDVNAVTVVLPLDPLAPSVDDLLYSS